MTFADRRTWFNHRDACLAICLVVPLAFSAFGASSAHAAYTIVYQVDQQPNVYLPYGASIQYVGGGSNLVGSGIYVSTVQGVSTPLNQGVQEFLYGPPGTGGPSAPSSGVRQAVLNFSTGAYLGTSGTSWAFAPGGSITIVGGADLTPGTQAGSFNLGDGSVHDSEDVPLGSTLLTGYFTGITYVTPGGGGFLVQSAGYLDTKDPKLLSFFGITSTDPPPVFAGTITLQFMPSTPVMAGDAFATYNIIRGELSNVLVPIVTVPEPSAAMVWSLLGGLGLARMAFRRRNVGASVNAGPPHVKMPADFGVGFSKS